MNTNKNWPRTATTSAASSVSIALVASCAVLAVSPAADAGERAQDGLEQVVITATRFGVEASKAPGSVSVVDRAGIEARNVRTLDQAVVDSVGVYAKRSKGLMDTLAAIQIRGIPGDGRTLVLLDGLPLNDGYTSGIKLGGLSPTDVSRIEILRGAASSLYGSTAIGGVVQVLTAMPEAPVAQVTLGGGSGLYSDIGMSGVRSAVVRLGTKTDGGWSLLGSFARQQTDGYRSDFVVGTTAPPASVSGAQNSATPTGGTTRVYGQRGMNGWSDHDATLAARREFANGASVLVRFKRTHYAYEYGDPTSFLTDAAGNPVFAFQPPAATGTLRPSSFVSGPGEYERDVAQLVVTTPVAGGQLRVLYGRLDSGTSRFSTPDSTSAQLTGGLGRLSSAPTLSQVGEVQWSRSSARASATVGASWRRDSASVLETAMSDWRNLDSSTGPALYSADGRTGARSAFAQGSWQFAPRLTGYAGLRYDNWRASDGTVKDVNPATGVVRPGFPKVFPDRSAGAWNPRLALVWTATDAVTLRASAGRAFRAPMMYDLYRTWVSTAGTIFLANAALEPESARSYDAGIDWNAWQGGRVTANLFRTNLTDLIYRRTVSTLPEATALCGGVGVTVTTSNCRQFVNAGAARSEGVEFEVRQALKSWLLFANATWVDSKVLENARAPASVGKRLTSVPEWVANAGVRFERPAYTLGVSARYVGASFRNDDNSDIVSGVYQAQDARTLVDAKATWRITPNLTAAASIDNVLDRHYFDFYRAPGRSGLLELTLAY